MAKKKKENHTWIIAGAVVIVAVVLYMVSAYSGLLSTKSFVGGNQAIATKLECSLSDKNILQAQLTVQDNSNNALALSAGSPLQAQPITWKVPASVGVAQVPSAVTDENGFARSGIAIKQDQPIPGVMASYAGDTISVNYQDQGTVTVQYGASSCEVASSTK